MTAGADSRPHWEIDRKVPVAVIVGFLVTIVVQSCFGAWWVSKVDSRVTVLELDNTRQDLVIAARSRIGDERYEGLLRDRLTLTRLEEQMKQATEILREIRQDLRAK